MDTTVSLTRLSLLNVSNTGLSVLSSIQHVLSKARSVIDFCLIPRQFFC